MTMQFSRFLDDWAGPSRSTSLPLAILPGEGIGPELIAACRPVLHAIEQNTAYRFDTESGGEIGRLARRNSGTPLTEDVVEFCRHNFARGAPVFCGPGGDRFVYELRRRFDIYCKFVPLQPLPSLAGTGVMRPEAVRDVDMLIVRENVGGLYQGTWEHENNGLVTRATHRFHYDEPQVRRILAVAINAAEQRRGRLCVVHKPGGTPSISRLWVETARQCTAGRDVELRFLEVDTAAYLMLAEASSFDVVVTPNMFGDVLADACAVLLGSRGMSYSYNLGGNGGAVFQTGHGAAYDLAGSGAANPLGQIQSLAALLSECFGLAGIAGELLAACDDTLAAGHRTRDIMAPGCRLCTTAEMGEAVALCLAERLRRAEGTRNPAAGQA